MPHNFGHSPPQAASHLKVTGLTQFRPLTMSPATEMLNIGRVWGHLWPFPSKVNWVIPFHCPLTIKLFFHSSTYMEREREWVASMGCCITKISVILGYKLIQWAESELTWVSPDSILRYYYENDPLSPTKLIHVQNILTWYANVWLCCRPLFFDDEASRPWSITNLRDDLCSTSRDLRRLCDLILTPNID